MNMQYLLISSACLSLFYGVFLLISKNEANFKQLRVYLLTSILLSFLIPLSSFKISFDFPKDQKNIETIAIAKTIEKNMAKPSNNFSVNNHENISIQTKIDWTGLFKKFYLIISVLLLTRIVAQVIRLFFRYLKAEKLKQDHCVLIYNKQYKSTFSFFNWIFINAESFPEDKDQLIAHEKIHASQVHSVDLILIELLAAVMWFNPLVWMMRNSIQLVHEYLADEGALSTGIDKLKYQALLINQVTEERLICLSSSFNHSLIKKRMIMMTKSKFNQKTKLKILALVPVAAILFLGIACVNGQNKTNVVAAVEPVRMNVLYLGADNPMRIAASGVDASELEVTIDNGTITGSNGEYLIKPKTKGSATVTVSSKGKEIQKTRFRVKSVPDPVAAIKTPDGLKSNGLITKKELLDANGIDVTLHNFDFDLNFNVVSFVLSFTMPNEFKIVEEVSKSDKYTERQINFIKSLIKYQKVTIEEITVMGPDGMKRKLSPMVFTISE